MEESILTIGIISDIQYCDQDNRIDYSGKYVRRYRQSLETLREASTKFTGLKTNFNVALGDIVDMSSKKLVKGPKDCLQEVIDTTDNLDFHFVLGNHDHACFTRAEIMENYKFGCDPTILSSLNDDKLYYSFSPIPSIRCIFLHSYDITTNGETQESDRYQKALQIMLTHNPTTDTTTLESSTTEYDICHYVKFNGGFSDAQVMWLEAQLEDATAAKQRCLLFSHVSIHKECTKPDSVIFNYHEVLNLVQRYSTVIAYFCGHEHQGGYLQDETGLHHIVPPSPLECEEGEVAYGILSLYPDHMLMEWYGRPPLFDQWPKDRMDYRRQ